MGWIPRPLGPNLCYHVRVQCNNRAFRFEATSDFERYLDVLLTARKKLTFLLHDFTIMHTHVHLIITTPGPVLLDRTMQVINHHYAIDYHRRYHRMGHFWMHGYRCSVIDTDTYALTCMRYVGRNAPRAGFVKHPADWPWCGYSFYACGDTTYPLDPHPSYLGLADTPTKRQEIFRDFVETCLPSDEMRDKELIHHSLRRYGANTKRKKQTTT